MAFLIAVTSIGFLPHLVEWSLLRRPPPGFLSWEIRFNGDANEQDSPKLIAIDREGHLHVVGISFNGDKQSHWLMKRDGANGRPLSRIEMAAHGHPTFAPDALGDVYLAGSEHRGYRPGPLPPPFSGSDTDFAVWRVSRSNGSVAWKQSLDGGRHDNDWAQKLVLAADGHPVAAGFAPDDTRYFGWVMKLDRIEGNVLWQYRTDEASVELWHGSLALLDGATDELVVASTTKSSQIGESASSFWLTKLRSSDGHPLWETQFPAETSESHILRHMAAAANGDFVAAGSLHEDFGRRLVVARFDGTTGRLLWSYARSASPHSHIEPTSLAVDSTGAVMVGARSWGRSTTEPAFDRWLIKLSAESGQPLWSQQETTSPLPVGAEETCTSESILVASDGTLVRAGSIWNGRDADVRVQWINPSDGSVLRSLTYDGAARDHDLFRDAALTTSGEVCVAVESSRCPGWLKPLKGLIYKLKGGRSWESIHRERNRLNDDDPFNYDCVLWRSRPPGR